MGSGVGKEAGDLLQRHAGEEKRLFAGCLAGGQLDLAFGDADGFCHELAERLVRLPVDGRGLEPDLQCVALAPCHFAFLGAGNDMDTQPHSITVLDGKGAG